MSKSASVIVPANAAGWQLWNGADLPSAAVDRLDSGSVDTRRATMGLPSSWCRTLPLHLPRADAATLDEMIRAQLEKRGLATAANGAFSARLVHEEASHCLISVDALTDTPAQQGVTMPDCAAYVAAVRLRPPPPGCLVLLEEQGKLVLVASRRGYPVAASALGPSTMEPGELVRELQPAVAGLLHQDVITPADATALHLWTEMPEETVEALRSWLPVPVETTQPPRPSPTHADGIPALAGKLIPPSVIAARQSRTRRKRFLLYSSALAVTYAGAVVLGHQHLENQEQEVERLRDRLNEVVEPAREVRESANRWRELQPALKPERFPVVQLDIMTRLMPPSGLVITKFESRADRVRIEGTARDPQVAFQFYEDIRADQRLRDFDWQMPQPRVRDDRTATFTIQGNLF